MAGTSLPNIPKIHSLIMMGITAFFVSIVVIFLFVKYFQRKRIPALTLALTFLMWALGGIAICVLGTIHYLHYSTPEPGIQYSRYGINLAYAFSALSNSLMVLFVSQIFSQATIFRKTKKTIPIINATLNGVTIGFVGDSIIQSFVFKDVITYLNPSYSLGEVIYHLVLTFFSLGLFLVLGMQQQKRAILKWEKAGFRFIIHSAMSGILVYLFFALDEIAYAFIPGFDEGYTIFNSIGWAFGILMALFAYLGYVMPPWLRNAYQEKSLEEK